MKLPLASAPLPLLLLATTLMVSGCAPAKENPVREEMANELRERLPVVPPQAEANRAPATDDGQGPTPNSDAPSPIPSNWLQVKKTVDEAIAAINEQDGAINILLDTIGFNYVTDQTEWSQGLPDDARERLLPSQSEPSTDAGYAAYIRVRGAVRADAANEFDPRVTRLFDSLASKCTSVAPEKGTPWFSQATLLERTQEGDAEYHVLQLFIRKE